MVTKQEEAAGRIAGGLREAANPCDLPQGTLSRMFLDTVAMDRPRAQLVRTDAGWQPISHAELYGCVRDIAAALATIGLRRGDRAALLSENRPEWAWTDYAFLCTGVLTVPVYPTLPPHQIAFILRHAGARAIFVSTAEQLQKIVEVRDELPDLQRIIVFDNVQSDRSDVQTLSAFMRDGAARGVTDPEFRTEALRAQPHDVATLIYTSGTTGEPKGVMLTHNNIHSNIVAVKLHVLDIGPQDLALSFLPLSHVFQRSVDYTVFSAGTTIAYVAAIDQVSQAMQEVRPTIAVAVPRVYEKVYARIMSATGIRRRLVLWARQIAFDWAETVLAGREPDSSLRLRHAIADRLVFAKIRQRLGGRIRFFVSGGAPLPPRLGMFFHGAGVLILEGYGLTETSPVTNVNRPTALRIGTVGQPIPGTEIRIADDGEILVRGPQIMKGYYRNDEATRAVIDEDGWFHTGDIGTIDTDRFLRITDRKKDLLVTAGGKNVAPQPIQNAAKHSRFIAEAVLIGDRRPYTILLVVPNFDALFDWARQNGMSWPDHAAAAADARVRAKLEDEVEQRLKDFARYERPKKVLVLPRELSLERGEITPTLKVKRAVVEAAYSDGIEALYAEPPPPDEAA